MLVPLFVFVGLVFCSLVSVFCMVFWPKWLRVLVTSKSSGPVMYLPWGFGYHGCLGLAWPLVKPKSSSEDVDKIMDHRGGSADWGCWVGFKEC